ncbi:MAG: BatA and WFA domain-containing protein [candidate division KSB1 bacterium]|nr:BatA and WFA domain-containing protein [candidate division KSB1 bacterium]MDQ7064600.1 BatA and WFA domain-containing protein [candidate division KSB1 bacterium]
MFTFLNSIFAWAFAAAAIPILIHLFTRKKLKVLPFSTLRFLQQMQREKIRQVRLRQWLLLILRTLIIALLVMAFMRPAIQNDSGLPGQKARTAAVLVIDNSLAMGQMLRGKSFLTLARQKGLEVLNALEPGDEITLIAAARPAQIVGEPAIYDPQRAAEWLNQIEQTAADFDGEGVLQLVLQTLQETRQLNREVYILANLTGRSLGLPADSIARDDGKPLRVFAFEWPAEKRRNLQITDVRVNNQIFDLNKVVEVRVTVTNNGDFEENGRLVHLFLNGKRAAQKQVDVPAGEKRTLLFRIVPETAGYQKVEARLENDQNPLDNRRFAIFSIPETIKLALIGGSAEDRLYVRLALQPQNEVRHFQIDEKEARVAETIDLEKYDGVILCNLPALSAEFSRRLQKFVEGGGGVVVFLGDDVDLRNYNEWLFARFGLGRVAGTVGDMAADKPVLRFGKISDSHPIFRDIFEKSAGNGKLHIDTPAFKFAVSVLPDAATDVIIEYSNQRPFLLEKPLGEGRMLVFMASAGTDWSDFPYKGIFAPLVHRAARYVAGRGELQAGFVIAGQPASIRLRGGPWKQFSIRTPDQRLFRVAPRVKEGGYLLTWERTRQTGFYDVLADSALKYVLGVNFQPQPVASDTDAIAELRHHFGEKNVVVLPARQDLLTALKRLRYGREIWKFFAILALLTLILETVLIHESKNEKGEKQHVVANA